MSAAGPPQGDRPLGGAAGSAVRGEPASAHGDRRGTRTHARGGTRSPRRVGGVLRRWLALALLVAATAAGAQAPPAGAGPAAAAAATTATRQYLVVFSLGPAWDKSRPPPEQPRFADHGRNLKRLRDAGAIVLGARYADKGMLVLRAESEAAARAEIENDPGVQAGIFTFELNELRAFYPGFVGNQKE